MKKILAVVTLLLSLSLVGCSNSNKKNTDINTEIWDDYSNCINRIDETLIKKYNEVILGDNIKTLIDLKNILIEIDSISTSILGDLTNIENKITNDAFEKSFNLTFKMVNDIQESSLAMLKSLDNNSIQEFNDSGLAYINAGYSIRTLRYKNLIDQAKNSVFNLNDKVTETKQYNRNITSNPFPNWYYDFIDDDNIDTEDSENNSSKIFTIKHGEFLSAVVTDDILVVKAKIKPSYNNEATINQNGYNIGDIIKNQGAYTYNEIQYWAVADMEDGSESKVISFTLNEDLIQKIKDNVIVDNKIIDYAQDVWILPSLKN